MPPPAISTPAPGAVGPRLGGRPGERLRTAVGGASVWLVVAAGVLGLAVALVALTGIRPGYDAFGWMVWGRQVLHWNLNTDGAPSWKPLPFLFTLPYALFGRAQMALWTVTAVGGALAGAVFAGRIAHRLTVAAASESRRFAAWVAAAFAAVGVLGISGYAHQIQIAGSDPFVVTLCLAAIDAHLRRRPRLAFELVVLAALGRPEMWPFAGLYALWLGRGTASARMIAAAGLALIPALWFVIPALTSKSWFISGDLAMRTINAVNVIHGSRILGVLHRLRGLYELPMQLAVAAAAVLALAVRDRRVLALLAAAALWTATEIAFALHGWSAAPRYLFEPAAVLVVVAAAGVGRALASVGPAPWLARGRPTAAGRAVAAIAGPALVLALLAALIPAAGARVTAIRGDARLARTSATELDRLESAVASAGGATRLKACGQPVTLVGNQSTVAWVVGLNVGDVGFTPGRSIAAGDAVVVIKPHLHGWEIRTYNMRRPGCAGLRVDSAFS